MSTAVPLAPPTTFRHRLRHIGPGLILSAAVVGSGELIATTALGARAGFVTFWVILVSCLMKVTLQIEFGKNAIYTGRTAMESFNALPGWRLGKAHWSLWTWLAVQAFKFLQVGGIVGGVGLVLAMAAPSVGDKLWAALAALATALLVARGSYRQIERVAVLMVVLFSLSIMGSLLLLQWTDFAVSFDELRSGLSFSLPAGAVFVALGAFGITGMGADEIMYYTYWCVEKGYARDTGPWEATPEWAARARGWIAVMLVDALLSMVVYTLVTAAFYLLGASLLHDRGDIPEGYAMVETLSRLFTATFGDGARVLFWMGAFMALFSTLFAATASWARLYADAIHQFGWLNLAEPARRRQAVTVLSWVFPLSWCLLYYFIQLPVLMILLGGVATTFLAVLVAYVALEFRLRQQPAALKPPWWYDAWLLLSVASVVLLSLYALLRSW